MRVVSGEYGGRHLKGLSGVQTRPTTDKVKESIFNMIGPYFDGGVCYDLYAGSGGLSIEAVSRGMDEAILFEKDRHAQQVILDNIAITKEPEKFQLIKGDCKKMIARCNKKAALVFLDPPYAKQTIVSDIERMCDQGLVGDDTIIVCETDKSIELPEQIQQFTVWKHVTYGISAVTIYHVGEE